MGRPVRTLKKTFVVFCEGDTECNYFNGMRKNLQNLELTLKPINMHGGGYKSFLQAVKKESSINRIATFIIVDGDRAHSMESELPALRELQEYCTRQNSKDRRRPYFLIVNCPDFEYVACLHDPDYSGGDTEQHIKNVFKFRDMKSFKGNPEIYSFLNEEPKSHRQMCARLRNSSNKVISNNYSRTGLMISFSNTHTKWTSIGKRGSNIEEVFDIILKSD